MTETGGQRVRWGIIGCGQIACDKVIPALAATANADLVALQDPDPARLDRARAAVPHARGYGSEADLLADPEVQAVYIATPNHLHCAQAIGAARAGKHVLVEKPMALTASEGREMVAAADQAGVKLMVAYMTLFNPVYRTAKWAVETGHLGEIVAVRGRHSYEIDPGRISTAAAWRLDSRLGGGPLMDVGVYSVFTLRDLTGRRFKTLSAAGTARRLPRQTDLDSLAVAFLLDDGTPGVIEAGFTFPSSHYELDGTQGRLILTGHVSQGVGGRLTVDVWPAGRHAETRRMIDETVPDGLSHFANYQGEVEHFGRCILAGEEPIASGRDAVAELEVTDAVVESLRSGRRVDL
jgi:D-xylose 1-dehydrogenase (NADP+, D-xylono-1,5-lactone-forming)